MVPEQHQKTPADAVVQSAGSSRVGSERSARAELDELVASGDVRLCRVRGTLSEDEAAAVLEFVGELRARAGRS